VIGDREINLQVRRQLPTANPIFYADVTPTSVHNTYIQILADLGVVGFVLFVGLIITLGVRTRALLRRLGRDHELWPVALVSALGLLLAVVWYNDNPLYGGQPETVLPALFVGILVAIAQLTAPRDAAAHTRWVEPRWSPGDLHLRRSYSATHAPAAAAPVLRPGAGKRLGSIAAIVLVSGVVGLIAGWGTATDEPALSPDGSEPATTHYDKVVSHELTGLNTIRTSDLQVLIAAETPQEQQSACIILARAYESTAQRLAQAHPTAAQRGAQAALVAKLRRVALGYRALATAAANVDTVAYDAARREVERAEAHLPPPLGSDLTGSG
jgi:hypothetical protein